MARRKNDLFIGREHINIEGRSIKHPALIKLYATLNLNKTSEEPIKLVGLDLETNSETGELKLLGFWDGKKYAHYHNTEFVEVMFTMIRHCDRHGLSLAYWNRLDPFVLFKEFLKHCSEESIEMSMKRFGKVSGDWNRKGQVWELPPVVEIEIGQYRFGIQQTIRSSLQFFFQREGKDPRTVWAFDIATLYENGLEKEATSRLPYYSKVGKEAHIVDWERFDRDDEYRNLVLLSNQFDSRAVYDLANNIQEEFKRAFKWYPRLLISQGSLARSAVVAMKVNEYGMDDPRVTDDIQSIGILNYLDDWNKRFGADLVKSLYALSCEAYSGGQIETYMYGYAKEAFTSDLASAYPATITELFDLRECEIVSGKGTPERVEDSYTFIRGDVSIPQGVDYHPLTVKHWFHLDTNIRPIGDFRASYLIEERDFLERLGSTFDNEEWIQIRTKGKLSPLADVARQFYDLRMKLIQEKDSAQYMAKIAMNSLYGIEFEAVDTYVEEEEDVVRDGYRAGEFFNPIYASIITAKTRIKISEACQAIKRAGGQPILVMTDSIFWTGSPDMLPSTMWKEKKTLGFFETPSTVSDLVCLGSGRYGYKSDKGYMLAKKRGLNAVDIHDSNGIPLGDFNWLKVLKIAYQSDRTKINVKVRALISVGMVLNNHEYTWKDLGRVVEDTREVDLIVGDSKRGFNKAIKNPTLLMSGMVPTEPITLSRGMNGKDELNDQTLPILREKMMGLKLTTKKGNRQKNVAKAVKTFREKNKDGMKTERIAKYNQIKDYGYNSVDCSKMSHWSTESIMKKLREDGKI